MIGLTYWTFGVSVLGLLAQRLERRAATREWLRRQEEYIDRRLPRLLAQAATERSNRRLTQLALADEAQVAAAHRVTLFEKMKAVSTSTIIVLERQSNVKCT